MSRRRWRVLGLLLCSIACREHYDSLDGDGAGTITCDPDDACKRFVDGACVAPEPPAGCTTTHDAAGCYALCPYELTWEGARTNCLVAEGWCLAQIDNGLQNQLLSSVGITWRAWIGLSQSSTATDPTAGWAWTCGGPLLFENWYIQADGDGVENGESQCAYLEVGNWSWSDWVCSVPLPSVCRLR